MGLKINFNIWFCEYLWDILIWDLQGFLGGLTLGSIYILPPFSESFVCNHWHFSWNLFWYSYFTVLKSAGILFVHRAIIFYYNSLWGFLSYFYSTHIYYLYLVFMQSVIINSIYQIPYSILKFVGTPCFGMSLDWFLGPMRVSVGV